MQSYSSLFLIYDYVPGQFYAQLLRL